MEEMKFVLFTLGEHYYGIPLYEINSIEQSYKLVPVPMGAKYVKGLMHLRNEVIPVYDLKEKFNIDRTPRDHQLLVGETHGFRVGLEVDEVVGIIPIPDENIKEVPKLVETDETNYLGAVVRVTLPSGEEGLVLVLEIDHIMSEEDFERLQRAVEERSQE